MPNLPITPYDILEVSPAVPRDQLKKAYEQAMRRHKYSATKVTKAYNDLRNGQKRLETDIFLLSQSGDPRELAQFIEQLPPCQFISPEVAPMVLPFERILLNECISNQHEVDIPANPFSTQISSNEIDPENILPTLAFPW